MYLLGRITALDGASAALRGRNRGRSSGRGLKWGESGNSLFCKGLLAQLTLVTVTVLGGVAVLVGGAPPGMAAAKIEDATTAKNNEEVLENILIGICCWGGS